MRSVIKDIILLLSLTFITIGANGQPLRVEPPHWWAGMKSDYLQLMVHQTGIAESKPSIVYPGVSIDTVIRTGNPNYLFISLNISRQAKAGKFNISFVLPGKKKPIICPYELKEREQGSADREGFNRSDIIYMLMPDRFVNGDTTNDNMPGMLEVANPSSPDGRHGGDIQGLIQHVPYFSKTLGVTAVWINPLVENNMPAYSYHGYAATDFYRIDPRFGTMSDYLRLGDSLHANGLKLVADMVFNHCGLKHWWMDDLPTNTWINQHPTFTRSNYRAETLMDPYAAETDRREMHSGWFDTGMPDLNQQDTLLARYLIQNSIWWIESAGLNGIRMDTWPYANQGFLGSWISAVKFEYPNFGILGETWLQKEAHTAYFQQNTVSGLNPASNLEFLTDFPLHYAINRAFREPDSWTGGISSLYYVLAQDFLYGNPHNLCIFLDNHDVTRFYTTQQEDYASWELGMTYLMTTRGIPVIYYGTEILMTGDKAKGDGDLRKDFPPFARGISPEQQKALNKTRELIFLRKSGLVNQGQFIHYVVRDGVYVYGWKKDGQSLMVMLNNNSKDLSLDLKRFSELHGNRETGIDLINGQETALRSVIIPARKALIFHIQ